ncbi:MAG: amidase family protein, partial [Saccharospirillum sp.]
MPNHVFTVLQLGDAIGRGEVDPIELTEQALHLAEQHPDVYLKVLHDRARSEAKQARWRRDHGCRQGPLDGVPMAWKDLFDIAGEVTTAGGRVFRQAATQDAEMVRRA